jgi:hypothetical protein
VTLCQDHAKLALFAPSGPESSCALFTPLCLGIVNHIPGGKPFCPLLLLQLVLQFKHW